MVMPSDNGIGGSVSAPLPLFGNNIQLGTFEFTAVRLGATSACMPKLFESNIDSVYEQA